MLRSAKKMSENWGKRRASVPAELRLLEREHRPAAEWLRVLRGRP